MTDQEAGSQPAISTETSQLLATTLVELDQAKAALVNSTLDTASACALNYLAVRDKSSVAFDAAQREYDAYKAANPDFDPSGCGGVTPPPGPADGEPLPDPTPPTGEPDGGTPSDGWQGTEPAEGTRRKLVFDVLASGGIAGDLALTLADQIEERLLAIEPQQTPPAAPEA